MRWGPYSVPAWVEPVGALGAVPEDEWFLHDAYAEWCWNTTSGHHQVEDESQSLDARALARHLTDVVSGGSRCPARSSRSWTRTAPSPSTSTARPWTPAP